MGGLDYLSENRKDEGLAQNLSITENTTLSAIRKNSQFGFLKLGDEHTTAARWAETLDVRCATVRQPVSALSGGNQQKVAIARMMHHDSDVFFMDEPPEESMSAASARFTNSSSRLPVLARRCLLSARIYPS